MKLRALLLVLSLAACGQATTAEKGAPANEPLSADNLNIEIGRYSVMLDHVRNLTADAATAASPDGQPGDPRQLARLLRETAWEYNLERSRMCGRGLQTQVSCGAPFEPVWLADPAESQPTLEDLKARADALGAAVQPFWTAICDDARAHTAGAQEKMYVCAIE